jgi:hypothetical protein
VFGQKRFGAFGVVRNSVSSSDFAAGKDGVSASGFPTKPEWPLISLAGERVALIREHGSCRIGRGRTCRCQRAL